MADDAISSRLRRDQSYYESCECSFEQEANLPPPFPCGPPTCIAGSPFCHLRSLPELACSVASYTGSARLTVVPTPGLEVMCILPPCSSTSCLILGRCSLKYRCSVPSVDFRKHGLKGGPDRALCGRKQRFMAIHLTCRAHCGVSVFPCKLHGATVPSMPPV